MNVAKTPADVLKLMKEQKIKAVDLRFMDFPGMQQHFTVPMHAIDADIFKDGLGFDGSSIRGWQAINESDMLVIPDPTTAFVDPFTKDPTLVMVCNIQDPVTQGRLHPRSRATSPRRRSNTCRAWESPTWPFSDRRPSSSSSIRCATTRTSTKGITTSIRSKASGTRPQA